MRETYQILNDREGNAHIVALSGGVHSHLSHKQAKELAALGNLEIEEITANRAARNAAQDEQIAAYKEALADPASNASQRALQLATESIESYYLKLQLEQAQTLILAQQAEIKRLTIPAAEPSPEFSPEEYAQETSDV